MEPEKTEWQWRRVLCCLAADVVAWCLAPAIFLYFYVARHLADPGVVVPHLRVVALILLGLTLVRVIIALSLSGRAARLAASTVTSALLATLIGYYGAVLIGLASWGQVISWELIASYSGQVSWLADALGISMPLAIGAAVLAYLGLLGCVWIYLKHFDWTPVVARRASPWLLAPALLSSGLIWAIELYSFLAAPPTRLSEPVSLTFFPMETARQFQFHAVSDMAAARRDVIEDAARAAYRPAAGAVRRNLILIVVDALRPDHMGIYGYRRDTTPNLSRLERAALLRKTGAVRASCSSSFCGLLSISSSRFVHQFTDRTFGLHEVLRRHGYRVHMILSGDHTSFYGLNRAYGNVDDYFDGHGIGYSRYVNDDRLVLDRLASVPAWDGVPIMMHFHLMSAHPLAVRDNAAARYTPSANYWLIVNRGSNDPSERGINFYDNGVVQADAVIRDILETLDRKGYLGNALVAITADHGEALGEHGFYQHANSVREEVLRVPFLLLSYGNRPERAIDGHVIASQIDIAPTLLAELGLPIPRTWVGAPLHAPIGRQYTYFQQQWEVGLYDHRDPLNVWKYWVNARTGEEYAFNLGVDPKESQNMIARVSREQLNAWRLQLLPGRSVLFERRQPPGGSPQG